MVTIDEIKKHFESGLSGELKRLEEKRLQIINQYSYRSYRWTMLLLGIGCITAIALSINFPNTPAKWGTAIMPITGLVAIVYPIIIGVKRRAAFKLVNREFKQTVLPKLLLFVSPDLTYSPEKGFDKNEFEDSRMFRYVPNVYSSEDLVEGKLESTRFRMADVVARQRSRSRNSESSTTHTIFSGLFIEVKLGKAYRGSTIIRPNPSQGTNLEDKGVLADLISTLSEKLQSLEPGLIRFGNQEFDSYYYVHSTDESEARSIINSTLMNKLNTFRKNEKHLLLSFTGDSMNIALSAPDMFEGNLHSSFLTFEPFRHYLDALLLVMQIIRELRS